LATGAENVRRFVAKKLNELISWIPSLPMNHLEHCAFLDIEITRFSSTLEVADLTSAVPSCPAWTVRDLGAHLGEVHRWAEHLVRERAQARISSNDMGLDQGPVSPTWMLEGGAQLLATLRGCDPDLPMWAWGADQHARFWSRRQLHETLLHRIDLELALGLTSHADTAVAADAIDEFLVNLSSAARFSPKVKNLVGSGSRLAFTQLDGSRRWVVMLGENGISFVGDDETADVELTTNTLDLLLVLYRRRQLDDVDFSLTGKQELLHFWLANSALE
jgi:uncharacterized protein (TIGR03083 family)